MEMRSRTLDTFRFSGGRAGIAVWPTPPSRRSHTPIFIVVLRRAPSGDIKLVNCQSPRSRQIIASVTTKGMFRRTKRFNQPGYRLNDKGQVRELREERL